MTLRELLDISVTNDIEVRRYDEVETTLICSNSFHLRTTEYADYPIVSVSAELTTEMREFDRAVYVKPKIIVHI